MKTISCITCKHKTTCKHWERYYEPVSNIFKAVTGKYLDTKTYYDEAADLISRYCPNYLTKSEANNEVD